MIRNAAQRAITLVSVLAVLAVACSNSMDGATGSSGNTVANTPDADQPVVIKDAGADADAADAGAPVVVACKQAETFEPLPARSAVMSSKADAEQRLVFTRDLFSQFSSYCGGCHVETNLGGFNGQKVSFENFSELVDQKAIDRITSDDVTLVMPPASPPWSKRAPDDPIRQFVELLQQWMAAGSPKDVFFLAPEGSQGQSPYLLSTSLGNSLTNIGNCVPDPTIVGVEAATMRALDAKFKKATELPQTLEETDLFTLDTEVLARHGVIAYAPGYPLWSDDAGKMRFVRVPVGESIGYDAAAKEFKIPPNTRFYKTFLKHVIDDKGREANRKIETRLIVSRPDDCSTTPCTPMALMGTYAWNDAETEATLVTDPLRDGTPFRDRVLTVVTDEVKAAAAGDDQTLLTAATRHYAIPGKVRCMQCHMGSPSQSFVLGFTPLQINRVPYIEEMNMQDAPQGHGVLEHDKPGPDELTQMQRLIDYGVVTGLKSPDQLLTLENSEDVPPRNGYELQAQAYMLGNCAHCHNPHGFPTVKNPVLKDLLNFFPRKGGGIFGFPLERFSPRVHRGENGDVDIPYVTPSLWDYWCPAPLFTGTISTPSDYTRLLQLYDPDQKNVCPGTSHDPNHPDYRMKDFVTGKTARLEKTAPNWAPWRSLIWRNVTTPFTYSDNFAIFPHMPLHTPGYDCRAGKILGTWMVSIPAVLKERPTDPATGYPTDGLPLTREKKAAQLVERQGKAAQPYQEIFPDPQDPEGGDAFLEAKQEALERLTNYQAGESYNFCADTSDILAPEVVRKQSLLPNDDGQNFPEQPGAPYQDNVPDRPHWVVSDFTEVPGAWVPRRGDWADILLKENPDKVAALDPQQQKVVDLLSGSNIRLTQSFREFALKEVPFGLWSDSAGQCHEVLSDKPTPASLAEGDRPRWMDPSINVWANIADQPIYYTGPGAAIFNGICSNCHGPQADGSSVLAESILQITGGDTRVANLRDGILGPPDRPGTARIHVFGAKANALGLTSDDMASHYLAWMGLGGTQRQIPEPALASIAKERVLGEVRPYAVSLLSLVSPNMLALAQALCEQALPTNLFGNTGASFDMIKGIFPDITPLIESNGDAELWRSVCAFGAKAPVRVVKPNVLWVGGLKAPDVSQFVITSELFDPDAYGSAPVMDHGKVVNGVSIDNNMPWCMERPSDPASLQAAQQFASDNAVEGKPLPICPDPAVYWDVDRQENWALRGAINAGMSVFVYLDAIARHQIQPTPRYDQCQSLIPTP